MKILIDNNEIQYLIVNERGKVLESGEEKGLDTFQDTFVDLSSVKVGKEPRITFRRKKDVYTFLNYRVLRCED